jgi:hypothetical protein
VSQTSPRALPGPAGIDLRVPDAVPVLSRGKHRRPSQGACFMEMASYLAGERWSDAPSCTHPLLAGLARLVNDCTSDAHRSRLATYVPSVVGLRGDDPRIDVRIALRCARTALPVVAAERQRVMAVSLLAAERVLARLDGRDATGDPAGWLEPESRRVLADVPDATAWARQFTRRLGVTERGFRRQSAPNAVRWAVLGIADACVPDPDGMLHDLLVGAIEDVRGLVQDEVVGAEVAQGAARAVTASA